MSSVYPARERVKLPPDAPKMGIALPLRGRGAGCAEFWMCLFQLIPPLNVKTAYLVQKGLLPGPARNRLLETALSHGMSYLLFLDDDVLFPDVAALRLWTLMQLHPEAAAITGVYTTKFQPAEPMLYLGTGDGAYWDWALGDLIHVESAGAGCVLVDLTKVKQVEPPWFVDEISTGEAGHQHVGHDRYFFQRLGELWPVYADTGLLLGHMDIASDTIYVLPPEAPCFNRPPKGEAFVPYLDPSGRIDWRRVIPAPDGQFLGYLDWLDAGRPTARERIA
ncbi:MAG: glycosyltransferase family A protein [Armatimonadota bacterium]|nr:glycosyltransferase family A protein [Armatimonadota bacterium]